MILKLLQHRGIVVAFTLVLLLAGFYSYQNLSLEAYPDVTNMQVRVITKVPGKAAEEVERLVTIPIEKELNGIPHSEPPRSISIFGLSVITVIFDDKIPSYVARQLVDEKINHADVPSGVEPELDPDASPVNEVYRYTVEGREYSATARKEWQDWYLERRFKSVPGIADVSGFGGPTKAYLVEIDPDRLRALNLSQAQVMNAIANSNGSTGGSYIVQNGQNYMVRGLGLLKSTDDIGNVVISSTSQGIPILVRDVASVRIGERVRLGQVGRGNDDDVVEGIILMRRGQNPTDAIKNVKLAWDDIQKGLPPGMQMVPLYDRLSLVHKTSETITHNVAEGIVLVIAILMLYLFQIRSALIAASAIPLALCTAMILLNVFHMPANLLSLGAIDFGIIVDASIIMVENIIRHLGILKHKGITDKQQILSAISHAASEVASPILFATLIIVITFLPIFTFEKVEGKLFRPLAYMMNFQLLGAVLAAMIVVPVLSYMVFSRKLPDEKESPIMEKASALYRPLLDWSMSHKDKVALIGLGAILFSIFGFMVVGAEFLPELEEGNIWLRVTVLPNSVSLDQAVSIAKDIRKTLSTYPEVIKVISQIGSSDDATDPNNYSNVEFFIDLKPKDEWERKYNTKQDLIKVMNTALLNEKPGLLYNFSQVIKDNMDETISGVKGELGIKIYGQDLNIISDLGKRIQKSIEKVPGMVDVAYDRILGQPQLIIDIDREKAARYDINTDDILNIVETSIGGKVITELLDGERRFAVLLRYQTSYRDEVNELGNILVSTPSGMRIPLSQLTTINESHGATAILRDKNERRVAVKANIRGRDLMSAVHEAQGLVKKNVKLPEGYHITWGGQFERARDAMSRLVVVVPITLFLIFGLLFMAFGSTRVALLVMLTIPLATPGAVLALLLTQTHFSISAGVGFIALSGVAVQNGVILVSLVNKLLVEGLSLKEAITRSALTRMKPALMTTTVAVVGLIPAAISTAIGAQSQRPFALVIVGGLIPGILLALMVLPAMYENFVTRKIEFDWQSIKRLFSKSKQILSKSEN